MCMRGMCEYVAYAPGQQAYPAFLPPAAGL